MTYSINAFLNLDQMKVNALYIADYLTARGWTLNAVAGMLGNMQTESTINPGIWQNLDEFNYSLGFGLVQWTPATKITDYMTANGWAIGDLAGQLTRFQYEADNNLQYYQTSSYPISFEDFMMSTNTPEWLAQAFLLNYERPANQNQPARSTQARFWYDYLEPLIGGSQGGGGSDYPKFFKGFKPWLYSKKRRF